MANEIKETEERLGTGPDTEEKNEDKVVYSNDVIATISWMAINDVAGLAGVCAPNGAAINRSKSAGKGIKVTIISGEVSVEVCVIAKYGTPIQKAASVLQDSVRKAIESMTGLHVAKVDVRVQNISFVAENTPPGDVASTLALDAASKPRTSCLDSGKTSEKERNDPASKTTKENKRSKTAENQNIQTETDGSRARKK